MTRVVAVMLGVPTLALVLWAAAHLALRRPPLPSRWNETHLPALPPADANGWGRVVSDRAASLDTPRALLPLIDAMGQGSETLLTEARERSTALAEHLGSADAAALRSAALEALERPRFADACPVSLDASCSQLRVMKAHRLASLEALRRAEAGDWGGALGLTVKLLAADLDFATTSRALISHLIALDDLERSTGLALALWPAWRVAAPDGLSTLDPASVARTRERLSTLSFDALGAQRSILVENMLFHSALISPGSPLVAPVAGVFVDAGRTLDEADRRTAALLAAAADPALPVPPVTIERQGALWWLYNPGGKTLLDGMAIDYGPHLKKVDEHRRVILARRPKLLALLGG